MAIQEMADIETLKEQAKDLKIKGYALYTDPEKLQQKIDEAKSLVGEARERKAPPKMQVFNAGAHTRNQVIARLEKEDPECKYLTMSSGLTPEELTVRGLEVVKKSNGEVMYHGDDIICRTEKKSYYEWQQSRNDFALKSMRSIDKDLTTESGGSRIQSLTESPKQGIKPE